MRDAGLYGGVAPAATAEPAADTSTAPTLDDLTARAVEKVDADERAAYAAAFGCREDEVDYYL